MTKNLQKIIIFEPWGLGDLTISLYAAKVLFVNGCKITLVCDPLWTDWVSTLDFINTVIPMHIPWTDKLSKYSFMKYDLQVFRIFKKRIKSIKPDVIFEVRCDVRNHILFHILGFHNILSPFNNRMFNRYKRIDHLFLKMGIQNIYKNVLHHKQVIVGNKIKHVFLFFDAAWGNRKVPFEKARRIIELLLDSGYHVTLILGHKDDKSIWDDIKSKYSKVFFLLKAPIRDVIERFKTCDILVSTDSAWMHIAWLHGVKTLALFGFDNDDEFAPPGVTVIYSDMLYPKKQRYSLKYKNLQPLSDLSEVKILEKIKDISQDIPK
jgi:ADP-heptose:LPS heptosyltransferase